MGMGTLTLLEGSLRGVGVEAKCEVLARRLSISAASRPLQRPYAYTDCTVIGSPANLPAGEYIVYFDGHRFAVTSRRGLLLSRGIATKVNGLKPTFVA